MRRTDFCLPLAWIIQLCLAVSITLIYLASTVLILLFNGINTFSLAYAFVTDISIASAAGVVTWAVICQFRTSRGNCLTQRSEIWKSSLATAVWIWLMLDAVFGPLSQLGDGRYQRKRIVSAASLLLLPCTIFYPTLYLAVRRNRFDLTGHAEAAYLESDDEAVVMSEVESSLKRAEPMQM